MIKNVAFQKVVYILLAVSILLAAAVVFIPTSPNSVVLAETSVNFDSTDVMDDLSSCVIDGEDFDINDYPKDPYGTLQVLTFVEYCYSFYENNNGNYGLYIYLYNPALTKFEASHVLNKIQMAVSFNDMDYADDYQKFSLKLCSKSSDGLFYKYKVVDTQNVILSMVQEFSKTHAGLRQYYVSGIELVKRGEYNATEYNVAMNYQYSGFAEGYGDSENFPLSMASAGIETLETEVHYTWWRPEGETEGGNNIQSQLNSVYFSVPNELLEKYGVLQAVSMEWYEYLTKWVFVIGDEDVYSVLAPYIGRDIGASDDNLPYGLIVNHQHSIESTVNNDAVYNFPLAAVGTSSKDVITALNYLFLSEKENAKEYILSGEKILDYIKAYDGNSEKINGKYYSELFENYVDDDRQIGYNQVDVKAEDEFSLTSYNLSQSIWDKFFGIANYETEEFNNIKGIEQIDSADFALSDASFSSKYFVNSEDASEIKNYCVSSELEGRSVFILRYAVTPYESKPTLITGPNKDSLEPDWECRYEYSQNAYAFKQTVFLDLDLIDVTFYKDGVSTVIPVVASPIDGIADGTPPVEGADNWFIYLLGIILGIIVLILILYVAGPILPYILKGIVWIITLPFRAIKAIIKAFHKKE